MVEVVLEEEEVYIKYTESASDARRAEARLF